jgi:hypothetical protein
MIFFASDLRGKSKAKRMKNVTCFYFIGCDWFTENAFSALNFRKEILVRYTQY